MAPSFYPPWDQTNVSTQPPQSVAACNCICTHTPRPRSHSQRISRGPEVSALRPLAQQRISALCGPSSSALLVLSGSRPSTSWYRSPIKLLLIASMSAHGALKPTPSPPPTAFRLVLSGWGPNILQWKKSSIGQMSRGKRCRSMHEGSRPDNCQQT